MKKKLCLVLMVLFCLPIVFLFGCSENLQTNHYKISAIFLEESKSLQCSEQVMFVNNSNNVLKEVCFFLYPNAFAEGQKTVSNSYFNKAYPNGESHGNINISEVQIAGEQAEFVVDETNGNILTVVLKQELFPEDSVVIDMEFCVSLANIRHRLGWNDVTINFGNFFPIACVYEDENGFVKNQFAANGDPFYSEISSFEVEITFPKEYVLASTGEIEIKSQQENSVATCKAEKVRDFCFVLSKKFEVVTDKAGKVQVNYFFYDDANAQKHLETAVKAVETFGELFGLYPYANLNVVKSGFCFGGMEYPNLVLIADDLQDDETVDYVIVHEIAHQWWYGLVGNNEFQSAWVDEGLTEFSTALFYEKHEEYGMKYDTIMANAMESYQSFVKVYKNVYGKVDQSMNRNLCEFETEPEYVNCTYTKGMLLFDSLRSTMSERKFFKCLKDYFKEYCFKNSSESKLIESFCKSSRINLEGFFNSWINGEVKIGG